MGTKLAIVTAIASQRIFQGLDLSVAHCQRIKKKRLEEQAKRALSELELDATNIRQAAELENELFTASGSGGRSRSKLKRAARV